MLARCHPLPASVAAKKQRHHAPRSGRPRAPRAALDGAVVADAAVAAADAAKYIPSELIIEPWQIYVGTIAGFTPFVIAAYEFGKRILIQRQCELCNGSGLVQRGKYLRKCTACGGFLPWQSWQRFLESSPGNGSVVQYPKGQTSVFFSVDKATEASKGIAAVARERMEQEEEEARVAASAGAAASSAVEAADGSGEKTGSANAESNGQR